MVDVHDAHWFCIDRPSKYIYFVSIQKMSFFMMWAIFLAKGASPCVSGKREVR
jgi:hypothetical protein